MKFTLNSASIEPSLSSIRPLVAEIWRFEQDSNSSKKKFGNFLRAKGLYRGPTKKLFTKIIIFVLESICMTLISYLERI